MRSRHVPEIIEHGVTGFIVDNINEANACVRRISEIDRARCRRAFEERFDSRRMALDYVTVYRGLTADIRAGARVPPLHRSLYDSQPRWMPLNG